MLKQRGPKVRLHPRNGIAQLRPAVASGVQRLVSCEVVWCVTVNGFLWKKAHKDTIRWSRISTLQLKTDFPWKIPELYQKSASQRGEKSKGCGFCWAGKIVCGRVLQTPAQKDHAAHQLVFFFLFTPVFRKSVSAVSTRMSRNVQSLFQL